MSVSSLEFLIDCVGRWRGLICHITRLVFTTTQMTTNDHGHKWVSTCIMQAHLHMRSYARLSTAGSFERHSATSLRIEHQCDCSARKLALGRTYTGRSFLEEEQHYRAFTESKRLTHLPLTFNKNPTFGENLRNQAFLDSEAPENPATNEPAFFRASKTMTLNVLIFTMDELC